MSIDIVFTLFNHFKYSNQNFMEGAMKPISCYIFLNFWVKYLVYSICSFLNFAMFRFVRCWRFAWLLTCSSICDSHRISRRASFTMSRIKRRCRSARAELHNTSYISHAQCGDVRDEQDDEQQWCQR